MKRSLLFIGILLFSMVGFSQKNAITVVRAYTGTIGSYPIELKFEQELNNDTISGSYYYKKNGADDHMYLKGTLKNGRLKMSESVYSRKLEKDINTGNFSLNIETVGDITGEWTSKTGNVLPVKLKSYLNAGSDSITQWQYKPHFYKKKERNAGGSIEDFWAVNTIDILNKEGKIIQKLTGFNEIIDEDSEILKLEDLNFDGYLDLKFEVYYPPSAKGNWTYLYFIFDPLLNKFISNHYMNDIGILSFDPESKTFSHSTADGSGNESESIYKWLGKKFFLIKTEKMYEDKEGIFITEYKVQNGKSVLLKEYKK